MRVLIGSLVCEQLARLSDTALTCLTPRPPAPKPTGPLALRVSVAGMGDALGPAGLTYQYADLWSRRYGRSGGGAVCKVAWGVMQWARALDRDVTQWTSRTTVRGPARACVWGGEVARLHGG